MNEELLLATLLSCSYTKQDILRRLRLLREYFEQKYFAPNPPDSIGPFLKSQKASSFDCTTLPALSKEFYDSFSKDNVYDQLDAIAEKIKKYPTINVYLPFAPDETEAEKLGKWFRGQIKSDTIIEIHVDKGMVGGMGFAKGGYFRDYSLRHYIEKSRDGIKSVVDKFENQNKTVLSSN
jgi:hypothetical protein